MAEIFSAPESIKKPVLDFANIEQWQKDEEEYIEKIKQVLLNHYDDKTNVGEIIRFPVGDGHACYMVMQMSPPQLLHLEVGDCWEFQYIERLTKEDIQQKIDQAKALAKLFS